MVKAACLLVMTWMMMMGSDSTDLFVAARHICHISQNDARVHSCIVLRLCTAATLKVGVYLWVSFVCGTDII